MNRNEIIQIFNNLSIKIKKNLGQNFLIDKNVLDNLISVSNLSENDIVLEIGAGLGALTSRLREKAKKIYCYEIDEKLYQYLKKKFISSPNIELLNQDILSAELPYHNKIVSNIPYSITGPILEKIFYRKSPPVGVLIIEKSIADRLFTKDNYKTFSRISVTFNAFMNPTLKKSVSPNCFYPSPKIELSMIRAEPKDPINPFLRLEEGRNFFLKFVAGIMPYKNKNLSNSIFTYLKNSRLGKISKKDLKIYLKSKNFDDAKLFNYDYEDFVILSENIYKLIKSTK
jgi:16S rRNA (adenine1518-N6/adenine1519-N6)-dimethyltransferase